MKFIMAYSDGKDCTLALDRMIRQGHEPVALYTTVSSKGINFNHFIRREVYQAYEECLGVPVIFCATRGYHNESDIHGGLREAIGAYGAAAVCTGDIFDRDVFAWNRRMAEQLGVELVCPLWNEPQEKLIGEVLDRGYRFLIKSVRTDYLGEEYLGKEVTRELVSEFRQKGIDVCGENGEYHSITVDGPVFRKPLAVQWQDILRSKGIATCDVLLRDGADD